MTEYAVPDDPESPAPPPLPPPTPPKPLLAGTFALYERRDGGYELVADIEGRGIETHTIPAALVHLLGGGGGPPGRMLRRILGMGEAT